MDPRVEALSAGAPGRLVRTSAGEIFVAERGRPGHVRVVALHAIGQGSADYARVAELVPELHWQLVDWPGHGLGTATFAPSTRGFAALLQELLVALGPEPVLLVGNSIGGAAALEVAARAPDRVLGLVLCDPAGLAPVGPVERVAIAALSRVFAAGARGATWFPHAYAAFCRRVLPLASAAHRERIVAAGPRTSPLLAAAWRSFAEPDADQREFVGSVKAPVWLAWSRNDVLIPWSKSRAACAGFTDSDRTMFPGGHTAFLEAPEAFAEGLRSRFVADGPGARRSASP